MRKLFFLSTVIFATAQLTAQKPFKRNSIYGEILGNGLILSVNYERQINDKPSYELHFGVGLGGDKPAFPIGVKYLFGNSQKRSFLEVGAGITLAEQDLWETNLNQPKKDPYKAGFIPSIGYRYHAPKGFMCRLNYTPVFNNYRTELLFFGVSVGWRI